MVKIILYDGNSFDGFIDRETQDTIWFEEECIFGDIIVFHKTEIADIIPY